MTRRSLSLLQVVMITTLVAWVLGEALFAEVRWWNMVMAGLLLVVWPSCWSRTDLPSPDNGAWWSVTVTGRDGTVPR